MLKTHINEREGVLLATSKVPAHSGHPLHKGTPREAFIKEFLTGHLSEKVAIGTGEIIDASSKPSEPRNQHDIVIYKRDYPKLDFGGGVNAFLVESIVSTIEVKSTLTAEELRKAFVAAKKLKGLKRNVSQSMRFGYIPPSVVSCVVAYDGPAAMETVYRWIQEINVSEGILYPQMPATVNDRSRIICPAVDAIIILGKGLLYFDNTPLGFLPDAERQRNPNAKWVWVECERGSLLFLFMLLTMAVGGTDNAILNPGPYLSDFKVGSLGFGI